MLLKTTYQLEHSIHTSVEPGEPLVLVFHTDLFFSYIMNNFFLSVLSSTVAFQTFVFLAIHLSGALFSSPHPQTSSPLSVHLNVILEGCAVLVCDHCSKVVQGGFIFFLLSFSSHARRSHNSGRPQ